MANFRDIDDAAKSEREAAEAKQGLEQRAELEKAQKNLREGEEWMRRVPLATLQRAKEELAGRYLVEFSDDFSGGASSKHLYSLTVTYSIEPVGGSRYRALPHYLSVDKHRKVKCIARSALDDQGPRHVFDGNIDEVSLEDIENHIADLVRWWVTNR